MPLPRRRFRGLGAVALPRPTVEVRICTRPDGPGTPPVCKDSSAFIDTGATHTLLSTPNLPPEMLPERILGARGHQAFVGKPVPVETREVTAELSVPGCTKSVTVRARTYSDELAAPGMGALIGSDFLRQVGATVDPGVTGRGQLRCHVSRRAVAPRRGAFPCPAGVAALGLSVCGHVTVCPPDAGTDDDPRCRKVRVVYDTGADNSGFHAHALDFDPHQYPVRGIVRTPLGPNILTDAVLSVPGCERRKLSDVTVMPPTFEEGLDGLVGRDFLVPARTRLHLWADPPVLTCRVPRRAAKHRRQGDLIDW